MCGQTPTQRDAVEGAAALELATDPVDVLGSFLFVDAQLLDAPLAHGQEEAVQGVRERRVGLFHPLRRRADQRLRDVLISRLDELYETGSALLSLGIPDARNLTWRVFRHPRRSPMATPTRVDSARESAFRPSISQMSRSRLTTCTSAGRVKRTMRASGRSFARDDA